MALAQALSSAAAPQAPVALGEAAALLPAPIVPPVSAAAPRTARRAEVINLDGDDGGAADTSEPAGAGAGGGGGSFDSRRVGHDDSAGIAGHAPRATFSGAAEDAIYHGCPSIETFDLLARLSRAGTFPMPFKPTGDTDYTTEFCHGGRNAVDARVLYMGYALLQNLNSSLAS